jgi:hypothetical protein
LGKKRKIKILMHAGSITCKQAWQNEGKKNRKKSIRADQVSKDRMLVHDI